MATIQGIQFENDANGKPIAITIDLKKYGEQLEPFFQQIGVDCTRNDIDSDWENAISSKEFLKRSIENIKKLPWKKQ